MFRELPRKVTGDSGPISARNFNNLVTAVRTLYKMTGVHGVRVDYTAGGIVIAGTRAKARHVPQQTQPVWIRRAAGSAGGVPGDLDNPCTFAYNGWVFGADLEDDDQRLFIEEQPLAPRTVVGKYDESPDPLDPEASPPCPAWAVLVKLQEDDFPTWHLWYCPGERWNVPGPCQPCLPGGMGSMGIMAV